MGKRNKNRYGAVDHDNRNGLGGWLDSGIAEVTRLCQNTIGVMVNYAHNVDQTLPMLFDDDDLALLRNVYGMVDTSTDTKIYPIMGHVSLVVDFSNVKVPSIEPSRVRLNKNRWGPLMDVIEAAGRIHERFEEVKAVLRYLNHNGTCGGIRYYWPTAMKLVPNYKQLQEMQHVPVRYQTPPRISQWAQALRDSATTIAGAQLLPDDAKPKPYGPMRLTFESYTVNLNGDPSTTYTTDQMYYNL